MNERTQFILAGACQSILEATSELRSIPKSLRFSTDAGRDVAMKKQHPQILRACAIIEEECF